MFFDFRHARSRPLGPTNYPPIDRVGWKCTRQNADVSRLSADETLPDSHNSAISASAIYCISHRPLSFLCGNCFEHKALRYSHRRRQPNPCF